MYRYIWKIKLHNNVHDDSFISHWREASAILQEYPGAKGTLIHKARDEDKTYFLVAQWESQAVRDVMQAEINAGETDRAKRWQSFPPNDSFGDIQAVMAGQEIGSVMPDEEL